MLEVPAVPRVTSRGEWEVGNRNGITPPPPQSKREVEESRGHKNP